MTRDTWRQKRTSARRALRHARSGSCGPQRTGDAASGGWAAALRVDGVQGIVARRARRSEPELLLPRFGRRAMPCGGGCPLACRW